ncbi:Hypoxia induced protein conserved region [Rhizoctonia solani]|uniref:Hypoxia induced protein conserved region n=1 Tax=Rhizoctonia solani TaxID=456999 RepID=A0A8H7H6S2_9AGAM|nr:Hypoxia induced protein conserved region [Rhizoctonia solani]KAF8761245.1 Hypoxia induced protein conserved region [Rhizoctonia solani]
MANSYYFPSEETYAQKGWRKCKEQPLVPIGGFLRFRVVAQGITVAACVGGTLVYGRYNKQEKDAERLRDEAEFAAYQVAKATATEPLGPPPTTAAQRRAEESIEDLVARAEALERAQSRKGSARDTLMAALAKQKAEKAEWAKQKEQAATTDK